MAALNRPTEATYVTHEEVTVDTTDREDHTFCGIMFPIKCKAVLPLDHVVIQSVAVRGRLGPLTVWVSKPDETDSNEPPPARRNVRNANNTRSLRMNPKDWDKVYERTHGPSFREYVELDLRSASLVLKPGQTRVIYIHSSLPGDEAIVYDNRKGNRTYDDALVSILTGRAHVSTTPFGRNPIWGWGNPWRDQREFVGRLNFGAVYRLWNPQMHLEFGNKFQRLVQILFLCQRRWESPWSMLPDECIFYILNMCRWDWADDSQPDMKRLRVVRRRRQEEAAQLRRAQQQPQQQQQQQERNLEMEDAVVPMEGVARMPDSAQDVDTDDDDSSPRSCCNRRSAHGEHHEQQGNQDEEDSESDEEYHAAREGEALDDDDEEFEEETDEDFEDEFEPDFDNDEDEDESDDEDEDWDSDDGYGANGDVFEYQDDDSDEDDENEGRPIVDRGRAAWLQRFRGIHVLHALAALDDDGVGGMHH